ncbi:hypothetical protein HMPREF1508_1906 [Shuttleworthella sp. MSX8B]|nr:hypothetical protein HMPREF1508_1906 [Shuttleworthia sp. MSX8B]
MDKEPLQEKNYAIQGICRTKTPPDRNPSRQAPLDYIQL